MHNKIKKIKDHTKNIDDIMQMSLVSFQVVEYFFECADPLERSIICDNNFFIYTIQVNWRICVIELHKLFVVSNNKFSIPKFIDMFKKKGEYYSPSIINENTIVFWEEHLQRVQSSLSKLKVLRDKIYAHTDKEWQNVQNELAFSEVKILLVIAQDVVNTVYRNIFDIPSKLKIYHDPVHDLKKMIKQLVDDKRKILNDMAKHAIDLDINPAYVGVNVEMLKENSNGILPAILKKIQLHFDAPNILESECKKIKGDLYAVTGYGIVEIQFNELTDSLLKVNLIAAVPHTLT